MQTGDCFKLPGCTVEVLQTYLDLYPNTSFAGINETSTVFKVTFDSGKSILITGDIYPVNCNWLVANYADSLKADIVQTPHHGRDGATAAFYDALLDDMQILLWTNSAAFLEARDGSANDAYDWSHNNAILTNTRIRQYHNSSDLVIDMTDLSTKGEN